MSGSGKSTLTRRLFSGETPQIQEQLGIDFSSGWNLLLNRKGGGIGNQRRVQVRNLEHLSMHQSKLQSTPRIRHVVVHCDFTTLQLEGAGLAQDPRFDDLSLFARARRVDVIVLVAPRQELVDRAGSRQGEILRSGFTLRRNPAVVVKKWNKHRRKKMINADPRRIVQAYTDWFSYLQAYPEASSFLAISDGPVVEPLAPIDSVDPILDAALA